MPKKKKNYLGKTMLFLLKTPYYIGKGIYKIKKKIKNKNKEKRVQRKRKSMVAEYKEFKTIHIREGDIEEWINNFYGSDSKIGIILGSRGSGKTAFGIKFLENAHSKYKKKCYALGFQKEEMPSWIKVVPEISLLANDSLVLIDEGGILFSSRKSMTNANKLLSELILIARHKNLSILFISQNSSNLDINILRQADFLILKPSSLLQKEFERKIVQKIYEDAAQDFERYKENKGLTYVYASNFKGFVSNPLPSFWKTSLSKSFK